MERERERERERGKRGRGISLPSQPRAMPLAQPAIAKFIAERKKCELEKQRVSHG